MADPRHLGTHDGIAGRLRLAEAVGTLRGQAIAPLHESLPTVAAREPELHSQFALIDIIRIGSARERKVAAEELEKRLG